MGKNLRKIVAIASILAVTSNLTLSTAANATTNINNSNIYMNSNTTVNKVSTTELGKYKVELRAEAAKPTEILTDAAGNFEYTKSGNEITLVNYIGNSKEVKVEIAETFDDIPITAIAENTFKDCENIEVIVLSKAVTKINPNAFSGCKNLKEFKLIKTNGSYTCENGILYTNKDKDNVFELVKVPQALERETFIVPDNVNKLSNYAFEGCTKISTIEIPSSVTTIGGKELNSTSVNPYEKNCSTFSNCNLESINVAAENTEFSSVNGILFDKTIETDGKITQNKLIKAPQLAITTGEYTIPLSVTEIEDNAFQGCASLNSITLNAVKTIGDNAFDGCGLAEINFDTAVSSIGKYVFNNCKSLKKVGISRNLTEIGYGAFNNCPLLSTINVNPYNNYYTAINNILYRYETKTLKFPSTLPTTVGKTNETKTDIELDLGKGETKILLPNRGYERHHSVIDGKLKAYESETPNSNDGDLSKSMTDVDVYDDISAVIPYKVETRTWDVMTQSQSIDGEDIFTPVTVTDINAITPVKDLKTINLVLVRCPQAITEDVAQAALTNNAYNLTQIEAFAFQGCDEISTITIPDTINRIGGSSFKDCSRLSTVSFKTKPDAEYKIGSYAFSNCTSLQGIELPTTLAEINSYLFNNCSNIEKISMSSGIGHVENTAFDGCSKLTNFVTREFDGMEESKKNYIDDKGVLFATASKYTVGTEKAVPTILVKYPSGKVNEDGTIIENYVLPSTVTAIKAYAFRDSGKPTSIKIGNLKSVTLPNQDVYEEYNAFFEPKYNVFDDSDKTFISKKVKGDITDSQYFVGGEDEAGKTLRKVKVSATGAITIESNINAINKDAFNGLSANQINLSTKINSIREGAFDNLSGVQSYNVDPGNTRFESNTAGFENNANNDKKSIFEKSSETDKNNNSIYTLIKYPSGVTDSGYSTPIETTKISNKAFENCLFNNITLGKLVSEIQANSFSNCINLREINVAEGNTDYKSIDGILFTFDGKVLVKYPDAKTDVSYTLPDGVEKISKNAFSNNKNIKEVKSTNSNINVEDKAFEGTQVEKVSLINSPIETVTVTSIEVNKDTIKTAYTVGDDLDLTNSTIKATKDNGTTEDVKITSDIVSGYDKTKIGTQTLTVTYGSKTATFVINVVAVGDKDAVVSSISANKDTFKTEYNVGQDLDLTNSTIKVLKSNDTSTDVKVTSDMISGYDKFKATKQTITISYQGKQTTVEVAVVEPINTGDASNMMLAGSLATIAMAGLAFVSIRKKSEIEE